jgi:hypothetical protein
MRASKKYVSSWTASRELSLAVGGAAAWWRVIAGKADIERLFGRSNPNQLYDLCEFERNRVKAVSLTLLRNVGDDQWPDDGSC